MSMPPTARPASASWESQAACLTSDPDLFFPIGPAGPALQQIERAKAICARCPVRCECLQLALATHQVHGVWGGTSEKERQLLRSRGPNDTRGLGGARPAARPGAPDHGGQ